MIRIGSGLALVRLLTPEDYGLIAMVAFAPLLATKLQASGARLAVIQDSQNDSQQHSLLYWFLVLLTFLLMALIAISMWPLANFFGEPRLIPVGLCLGCSFFFVSLRLYPVGLLQKKMQFKGLAIIRLIAVISASASAITMAALGFRYWSLVVLALVDSFIFFVGANILCGSIPKLPSKITRSNLTLIRSAFNVSLSTIAQAATESIDKIVVGRLLGSSALGIYDRARNIPSITEKMAINPVDTVAFAASCNRKNHGVATTEVHHERATRFLAFTIAALSAVLILLPETIINVLYGPKWVSVIPLLPIVSIFLWARFFNTLCRWKLLSEGRDVAFRNITLARSVMIVLLVVVLARPEISYMATLIAICYVAAAAFGFIFAFGINGQIFNISRVFWQPAALLTVPCSLFVMNKYFPNSIPEIMAAVFVALMLVSLVLLMKPLRREVVLATQYIFPNAKKS